MNDKMLAFMLKKLDIFYHLLNLCFNLKSDLSNKFLKSEAIEDRACDNIEVTYLL